MSAGAKRLEFAHHSDILLVDGGGDMRVDLLVGRPGQRPEPALEVVDAVVERAWFPWEIRKVLLDLLVGIPDLGHAHVGLVEEEDLAVSEVKWCDAHKTRLDEPYTGQRGRIDSHSHCELTIDSQRMMASIIPFEPDTSATSPHGRLTRVLDDTRVVV